MKSTHCNSQVNQPDCLFNLMEVAKLESNINGVLAAVTLTVVVVLIFSIDSRKNNGEEKTLNRIKKIKEPAISAFLVATLASLLASYLFATVAGTHIGNERRAFFLLFPAGFSFIVSALLFQFGILISLIGLGLTRASVVSRYIFGALLTIILIRIIFTAIDQIAVMDGVSSLAVINKKHGFVITLTVLTLLFPILATIIKLVATWNKAPNFLKKVFSMGRSDLYFYKIETFFITTITMCVIFALFPRLWYDINPTAPHPDWVVWIYAGTFGFLAGWLILFIPTISSGNDD